MKKSLSITALFLVLFSALVFSPVAGVSAQVGEYNYFQVKENGVILYSQKNASTALFEIPKSYYVEYTDDTDAEYYGVRYHGVNGYISRGDVAKLSAQCKFNPQNSESPYYQATVSTSQPLTPFFQPGSSTAAMLPQNSELQFIGKYTSGNQAVYFVRRSNSDGSATDGYVYESFVSTVTITDCAVAPVFKPENPNEPNVDGSKPETPENNLTRILLIVAICILSLLVVFLLFKPVKNKRGRYELKKPRRDDDYDDDDYYR